MREWNLSDNQPIKLTLAADVRMGQTRYDDDQIWELTIGGGDPPAVVLQTTFGLRARTMRLFPRFKLGDQTRNDPSEFERTPTIHRIFPNMIALTFSPFPYIDVKAEYWVPESRTITGRLEIHNSGDSEYDLYFEWVGQLTPTSGQRMSVTEIQDRPVLCGSTDGLFPLVYLSGEPQLGGGSYPGLSLQIHLEPDQKRQVFWSHAALNSEEDSFHLARQIAGRNWDAEMSRVERLNSGLIEVFTGDSQWDLAFALSQKLAYSLFLSPTEHLPLASMVFSRQPDQGYSIRGDGSDYSHLWTGQTPLDAYYLSSLILPSYPSLAEGLLRNFLAVQDENGFIDWKPGLGGQRSRLMATPVLATLAWRIFEVNQDLTFLQDVFPGLLKFFLTWFSPDQDRDRDGIPEWNHALQSGLDDHPVFSRWYTQSLGVDITTSESPALCAFLYTEAKNLIQMAEIIDAPEPISALQTIAAQLESAVKASWNSKLSSYVNWDRETHHSTVGEKLGEQTGSGLIQVERKFEHPVRVHIRLQTDGESTRRPDFYIQGSSASGNHRVEHVGTEKIKWYLGVGSITGDRVYTELESIEIRGIDAQDRVELFIADYSCQDISLLLPLWAGIPDKTHADHLVEETILNPEKYWQPFGLSTYLASSKNDLSELDPQVNLIWNSMVAEGLVRYGFRSEAADLLSKLMEAIKHTLQQDQSFRQYYQAETGNGIGDRNVLSGFTPLGLFLQVLGVQIFSQFKIGLSGKNPFPWPVTLKYRGTTILRQKEKTMIIFPNGQTVVIDDPEPRIVSLETG